MQSEPLLWAELVAFANHELLTPALWVALCDKELASELPDGTARYLRRTHAVNRVRNERLWTELKAIIAALNEKGIEPVLLKGAIDLAGTRYSDSATRIMRDLDILVMQPSCATVFAILNSIGYHANNDWLQTYFSEFSRPGSIAAVDLHWYVSAQRDILPPEEAHHSSVATTSGNLRFRILSPEHQIVHNVLHSELQDGGSMVGFVWLRQLLELVAICRHYEEGLDWDEIRRRFSRRGLDSVLVARLYMAHRLLGLAMPPGIRPTLAARMHYQRCLAQLRWRSPMTLVRICATIGSQFDARLMDLIYDSGTNRMRIGRDRVRHALRLVGHHGLNLGQVIRKRRTKFE